LKERGVTQDSIAKEAQVSPATISQFIRRKFKSERLSRLLDKKLGVEGAIR
jgi:predicted transcriptional regulator